MRLPSDARAYAVGIGVLAVLTVTLLVVYSGSIQRVSELLGDGRTVRAVFADTQQLKPGDDVRIAGVNRGKVKKIELNPGARSATVTMRLSGDPAVHADARAALRFKLLLGGALYVDLEPGTRRGGDLGSRAIPLDRTTNQVEVDDVATIVKGGARAGLRTLPKELAKTFADPAAPSRALRAAADVAPDVQRGVNALRGREGSRDLRALVRSTASTVHALDTRDSRLTDLIEGGAATMAAIAARRGDVVRTLSAAPAVARRADVTMARLDHTLGLADTLLRKLRGPAADVAPTLARLRPTAAETDALLRRATPLLRSLRPAVTSVSRAARDGQPLLRDLEPSVTRLDKTILPYFAENDPETNHSTIEMFGGGVTALATAGVTMDANGHLLSFPATAGSSSLLGPCNQYFADPSAQQIVECQRLDDAIRRVFAYHGKRDR